MDKKEEKALEVKSKMQKNVEGRLPGRNWDYIPRLIKQKYVIWFPR